MGLSDQQPQTRPVPADPERSRHPDVLQGPACPQAGGLRGPPAAPLAQRAEPAVGAFGGARAAGAQWVGPDGPGEERGCRAAGAGRGGRRPRPQRQLQCDQARQRREREVRAAQLRHVSVPAVSGSRGPGGGLERRVRAPPPRRPVPSQRRPVGPGSVALAAALFHITPDPGPGRAVPPLPSPWARRTQLRPQKPSPAALPRPELPPPNPPTASPRRPVPQGSGGARPEGGPSAPARAPAWSRPGSPAAFATGKAEPEMGRRRKGVQVGLQDELIFPAPPSDLSRFGAWPGLSAQTWSG